ncbi:MAG: CoA-binding protein [Pseudomonadota bacterium]
MNHDSYEDAYIRGILMGVRTVAIVGASANKVRPSYFVTTYLDSKGFDVIPVNPGRAGQQIAELDTAGSLADIDRPVDLVDIFRKSDAAVGVVQEALQMDPLPNVIWMQLGVKNYDAARLAEEAGLKVVMNRCPKIEYARLCGEIGWSGVASGVITSRKPKLLKGIQRFSIAK